MGKFKQFFKYAAGFFFTLIGAAIFGSSQGKIHWLLIGGSLAAIGIALILSEY